jgi:hypothetical protein
LILDDQDPQRRFAECRHVCQTSFGACPGHPWAAGLLA